MLLKKGASVLSILPPLLQDTLNHPLQRETRFKALHHQIFHESQHFITVNQGYKLQQLIRAHLWFAIFQYALVVSAVLLLAFRIVMKLTFHKGQLGQTSGFWGTKNTTRPHQGEVRCTFCDPCFGSFTLNIAGINHDDDDLVQFSPN